MEYRRSGKSGLQVSALACGLLTGQYNDGFPADSRLSLPGYARLRDMVAGAEGRRRLDRVRQLTRLAQDLDTNMARLALAWWSKESAGQHRDYRRFWPETGGRQQEGHPAGDPVDRPGDG